MRVISGVARGRKLQSMEGLHTRPTADRVKESMFNILMEKVAGARVLDVFAGSGALGIEALSRGAESCVFIENDINAVAVVKENLTNTKLLHKATVHFRDALSFLKSQNESYDIIFIDPPYDAGLYNEVLATIVAKKILNSEGVVVIERRADSPLVIETGLTLLSDRKYGKTAIQIMGIETI